MDQNGGHESQSRKRTLNDISNNQRQDAEMLFG